MPPALQKRIAGLPAWAWAAVLAGGLTIGLILRSRQTTPAEDETEDDTYVDDPVYDDYSPDDAGYYMTDPGFTLGGDPSVYGAYNFDQDAFIREFKDAIEESFEEYFPDGATGGSVTTTQVGCTNANKPKNVPKGYKLVCKNDRWHLEAKPSKGKGDKGDDGDGGKGDGKGDGGKHHGGKGDGGKGHGGKDQKRANPNHAVERTVTGGGPPRRRGVHTPSNNPRAEGGVGRGGRSAGSSPIGTINRNRTAGRKGSTKTR